MKKNKSYKSYYTNNRVWVHVRNILWFPVFLVARILPKLNIKVFGSMNGYAIADNSKYYFINEYRGNYYWITKNKSLIEKPIFNNHYPIYAFSLKGVLLQIFAKEAYYTHRLDDFIPPLIMGANIVAFWHGVPFKKIGAAEKQEKNVSKIKKLLKTARTIIMPYTYYMYCNELYCPDAKYKNVFNECFSISKPKLIIENYPRVKFAPPRNKERRILYCPTYRKNREIDDVIMEIRFFDKQFINWLEQNNITLVIRPHPIDADKLNLNVINSRRVVIDTTVDVYDSINLYPVIITDYSSIMFDARALGINVYILADDIDDYEKSENGLFPFFINEIKENHYEKIQELIPELEKIFS